ncbi:hypothetical protein U1Q18_038446 [Sarracenia purpurea var. burkii]
MKIQKRPRKKRKEKLGRERAESFRSMTSLQRSSVSFRRWGSSGRIWNDRLQQLEPKPIVIGLEASKKTQLGNIQNEDIANPQRPTAPPPPSKSKVKKCSFSTIFGRCVHSPA